MSDTHLPDDVTRWPDDAYALLGVSQNVDRRELRRAYTKLIRIFKPDHFPEQFRRIRDAYENLDGFLKYRDFFENQPEVEEAKGEGGSGKAEEQQGDGIIRDEGAGEIGDADAINSARTESVDVYSGDETPHAGEPRRDEAAAAWQKALDGNRAAAYRELRELERRRPGDADLCVRLYWLLALSPKLDPFRDRRGWLARALRHSGLSGAAMELYERELQGEQLESLQARCKNLLECDCPPARLANFAQRRWEAAAALSKWEIIAEDLQALRERIFHADHGAWTRLLLAAVETLSWQSDARAQSLAAECRREADVHSEEHQNLEREFYRCDLLAEIVAGWKELEKPHDLSPDFRGRARALLREGWLRPFGAVRPKLLHFWRPLAANPRQALAQLDRLFRISAAALQHLHNQAESLYLQRHDYSVERDRKEIVELLRNLYESRNWSDYAIFRNDILFFCIRLEITLPDFMELSWTVLTHTQIANSGIAERLRSDLPLQCLLYGCLAFWS